MMFGEESVSASLIAPRFDCPVLDSGCLLKQAPRKKRLKDVIRWRGEEGGSQRSAAREMEPVLVLLSRRRRWLTFAVLALEDVVSLLTAGCVWRTMGDADGRLLRIGAGRLARGIWIPWCAIDMAVMLRPKLLHELLCRSKETGEQLVNYRHTI